MSKPNWLYDRNGVWYFRAKIRGKIVQRAIGRVDKVYAAKVARDWYKKALEERLNQTLGDPARNASTVQDLVDTYRTAAARIGEPRPQTVHNNIASLRTVIRKGQRKDVTDEWIMQQSLAILDEDLVNRYVSAMIQNTEDEAKARRTLTSTLTQARSLLSRKMIPEYKRLNIPACVQEFKTVYAGKREKKRYRLPPKELRTRTAEEAQKLAKDQPALYVIYLLCFHLGMRAKEAAFARWTWFEELDDGRVFVHIINRPEERFSCKGSEGTVPVPLHVWKELKQYSSSAPFILAGDNKTNRYNLIQYDFAAWMRSIGWVRTQYPKAAHELRKLIGSMWYKAYGQEGARERLRQAEVQTTLDHYAHLDYTDMEALNERAG